MNFAGDELKYLDELDGSINKYAHNTMNE